MNERSIRTAMLLGENAIETLAGKHVAVFGIGGVGGFCAEALARAGVGALTLVDDDTVSVSNLNRQLVALRSTVGMPKTEVMAARIADIDPDCRVTVLTKRYTEETKEEFFSLGFDYIADCIDSVACKTSLIETSIRRQIPIISAMGTGNKLDPTKFQIADIAKTSVCPLARVMRKECAKRGIRHLKVLFSTEDPIFPPMDTLSEELPQGRRSLPGSVAFVPSVAGLIIAGEVIKDLTR